MAGRVAILTETFTNTIAVEESVLRRTQSGYQVVVIENGRAVIREVEIGISSYGMVQVTEGLQPGDSLVVAGQSMLSDGAVVEVVSR
jgi:membrane fusion protein, multidrug efflux system